MLGKLKDVLGNFTRKGIADKRAVDDLVREIQRVLIQSDVDVKLVFELTKSIKENARSEKVPAGLTRREHVVKIVHDELVKFLGEKKPSLTLGKQRILLLGLFGSGKTTSTAKIANFYSKRGLSVGMISCDVWRPAAYEQLKQLGKQISIDVYGDSKEKNPVKIVKAGLKEFRKKDVVIVDSAGRSALDNKLKKELEKIDKEVKADEKLLVLSGDIGQAAGKQAEEFNKLVGLTGVLLTKMDSSAKGGGALSACFATGVNVKLIGTGEKTGDLEIYDPARFVSRLLGMGDIEALLEKAKEHVDVDSAAKIMAGEFTLEEFYSQIESMKKMGSMQKILDMVPGMGKMNIPKEMMSVQEEKMKIWKYIIDSMTPAEKKDPEIINKSRVDRIAKGSGRKPEEVRELLKQFRQMKKMMKKMKSGKMFKRGGLGKMFRGGMPF